MFLYFFMNKILKIGMVPNIGGLANTALLNVNNGIYALHEMDYPYLIDIDFKNNSDILDFIKDDLNLQIPTIGFQKK